MSNKDVIMTVVNRWGLDKTIKVVLISVASAAVAAGICTCVIPDSPNEQIIVIKKENEQ